MDSARDRMVVATAELLAEDGLAGVTLGNVLSRSAAPRGSIYHYFPGGKDALVGEAVRWIGGRLAGSLTRTAPQTPGEVAADFARPFRRLLTGDGPHRGCAVAAVASSAPAGSAPADAAKQVFTAWQEVVSAQYAAAGVPAARCLQLAASTVVVVEGALVLARAFGDIAVFDDAVGVFVRSVADPAAS